MIMGPGMTESPHWINARLTVNEAFERWPDAVPAMRRYGLEQGCCGGLTLAAVAERNNLDVETLLDDLRDTVSARRCQPDRDRRR